MNHAAAKQIFDEIRARPYGVSTESGVRAENCYFKGTELLQRLGTLGYAVRGCVGETYWDPKLFPADVLALEPREFQTTHFWCEALLDDTWKALDPSFDPPLAAHGFTVAEFGDGHLCFPVTKHLTHEENIAYQAVWSDPDHASRYYDASLPFLQALNMFFAGLR